MATQSSILAWEIPWTEEPGSYCPWGRKESDMSEYIQLHSSTVIYGNEQPRRLGGLSLCVPHHSHQQPSFRTSSPALSSDVLCLKMLVRLLISCSLPPHWLRLNTSTESSPECRLWTTLGREMRFLLGSPDSAGPGKVPYSAFLLVAFCAQA